MNVPTGARSKNSPRSSIRPAMPRRCAPRAAATSWRPAANSRARASKSVPVRAWRVNWQRSSPASWPACRSDAMSEMPALNPQLDVGSLAEAYQRNRRLHIPNILTEQSAVRVHRCLEQETDFALLARNGPEQGNMWRVATLTGQQQAELMTNAYSLARDKFHFLYDAHSLSTDGEPYPDPSHYLAAVTQFLNSAPLLDFI